MAVSEGRVVGWSGAVLFLVAGAFGLYQTIAVQTAYRDAVQAAGGDLGGMQDAFTVLGGLLAALHLVAGGLYLASGILWHRLPAVARGTGQAGGILGSFSIPLGTILGVLMLVAAQPERHHVTWPRSKSPTRQT